MGRLVKLIGSGIGLTSEAIHAARNRSSNQDGEYVIADDETADALIREGRAELPAYSDQDQLSHAEGKKLSKAAEAGYASDGYGESNYSDSLERGVDQDEAVWELDETAQRVRPPAYEELESTSAPAPESEEAKQQHEEDIVRSLVRKAGPVQTVQRIPCPVIIPQRRPGKKDRGFVRAYAPVLGDCGINQDVFLAFLEGFFQSSKASKWVEVVFVAAGIVGFVPEAAAQITSAVVQVVAGTARELQSRHRANTFLDRVNQDLFMPRGLYAMVMAFKDEVPGQQSGPLGRLSQTLGQTLFATGRVDVNQSGAKPNFDPNPTIAKYTQTDEHAETNKIKQQLKNIRVVSGKTRGQIQLPEAAPLVYPDLDRAAAQATDGKGKESEAMSEKFKGAGAWVQDYFDRKAQASYEYNNPGSSLAVPESGRQGFVSRYSDPNHPANNGRLISLLTGGKIEGRPGPIKRAANSIRESREARRNIGGESPGEPIQGSEPQRPRKRRPGLIKKVLQQDVLYLLIVNMPTEEEMQQSVAQLERLMQGAGQHV
ncbi:hypothetical protein B0T10DRAFT_573104 [Thelonectria olida]|uniref:Uncharacterized protein n=1 Tax=Thelonectria olida TaxID=1576542 RepID=A0A9P9ANN0_9HYPO|nr:hypothetical protein B0T10DRAFT_573104 [Thelonectria olida]